VLIHAVNPYVNEHIKGAMVGGQYHIPNVIFYRGNGKAKLSLQELRLWFQREFMLQYAMAATSIETSHTDVPKNAGQTITTITTTMITTTANAITWIDVCMGLGPFSIDMLMLKPEIGEPEEDLKAKLEEESNHQKVALKDVFWKHFQVLAGELDHWFPGSHHPFCNKAALKVAQGYENV